MKNSIVPAQNLLFGGASGVEVYASTIKAILMKGQSQSRNHHYIIPYYLQAMNKAFQDIIDQNKLLFIVKRDIYSPNNVSVLHVVKTFPKCRFAEAYLTIRNGSNISDTKIRDDINYASLFDSRNHATIHVIGRNANLA